jgi:dsRNA-specific ribonuclease
MHALSSENYKELEDKIGYHFKNPHYLQTALTHRSYQNSREKLRAFGIFRRLHSKFFGG